MEHCAMKILSEAKKIKAGQKNSVVACLVERKNPIAPEG
jgi:hypothetical protein